MTLKDDQDRLFSWPSFITLLVGLAPVTVAGLGAYVALSGEVTMIHARQDQMIMKVGNLEQEMRVHEGTDNQHMTFQSELNKHEGDIAQLKAGWRENHDALIELKGDLKYIRAYVEQQQAKANGGHQ